MLNVETGRLYDSDGKQFDITVIFNWPKEEDYAKETTFEDCPCPKLIDYYFGDTKEEDTDFCVGLYIERQDKFKKLLDKLNNLKTLCPEDTDLDDYINFIKDQINPRY